MIPSSVHGLLIMSGKAIHLPVKLAKILMLLVLKEDNAQDNNLLKISNTHYLQSLDTHLIIGYYTDLPVLNPVDTALTLKNAQF